MKTDHDNVLEVEDLGVSFDGFKAVDGFNFYLAKNHVHVIIGPNGAGKTTVLDMICGKTLATSGSIKFGQGTPRRPRIQDRPRRHRPEIPEPVDLRKPHRFREPRSLLSHRPRRDRLPDVPPHRRNRGASRKWPNKRSPDKLDTEAAFLSHGQKQWLEIGMLLMQDPEMMMLDEPVAGMSVRERTETALLIRKISKDRSIIVIEHDMEFVREIAKSVTVLHLGKILAEGSMEKFSRTPKSWKSTSDTNESMISVTNLNVCYGQSDVIHDMSFTAPQGDSRHHRPQRHGQDHALQLADRHIPSRSGKHPLSGKEISNQTPTGASRQGVAFVPQGRMIFPYLTVYENMLTGVAGRSTTSPSEKSTRCSPCCRKCANARAATSPAASSSSSPSPAR